jgi:hypothetical protein
MTVRVDLLSSTRRVRERAAHVTQRKYADRSFSGCLSDKGSIVPRQMFQSSRHHVPGGVR